MSATVIILLIGLWVVVLMPGLLRARRHVSPATSISRFNHSMDRLARTRQERGGSLDAVPLPGASPPAAAGPPGRTAAPTAAGPPWQTAAGEADAEGGWRSPLSSLDGFPVSAASRPAAAKEAPHDEAHDPQADMMAPTHYAQGTGRSRRRLGGGGLSEAAEAARVRLAGWVRDLTAWLSGPPRGRRAAANARSRADFDTRRRAAVRRAVDADVAPRRCAAASVRSRAEAYTRRRAAASARSRVEADTWPRATPGQTPSAELVARRRVVLGTLVGTTLLGAVVAPLLPTFGWTLGSLGAAASVTYVAMLWRLQQRRALRQRVRHLDRGQDAALGHTDEARAWDAVAPGVAVGGQGWPPAGPHVGSGHAGPVAASDGLAPGGGGRVPGADAALASGGESPSGQHLAHARAAGPWDE